MGSPLCTQVQYGPMPTTFTFSVQNLLSIHTIQSTALSICVFLDKTETILTIVVGFHLLK